VVTTADQAIICALAGCAFRPARRLIPTRFVLNAGSIWSVAATRSGRIFLGGRDGHLYEMDYAAGEPIKEPSSEERLAEFYDGDKVVPNVLYSSDNRGVTQKLWAGSKRILEFISSSSAPGGTNSPPPQKCRKLDHSSDSFATSRFAKAVVPDILLQATDAIFSNGKSFLSGKGKGPITKILIDEERACLYTLNSVGWIASFDWFKIKSQPSWIRPKRLDCTRKLWLVEACTKLRRKCGGMALLLVLSSKHSYRGWVPIIHKFVVTSGDDMLYHRYCCHNIVWCKNTWKSPADVASMDLTDRMVDGIESTLKHPPDYAVAISSC
jgi:hypothetical protein